MCSGFVGTCCRRNDSAAVHSVDTKTSIGGDDKDAVRTADKISTSDNDKDAVSTGHKISIGGGDKATIQPLYKISTSGGDKATVQPLYKISIGGDDKDTVRGPERLSLRPVCIFACGKTHLLRPTPSNMSRCNHFFAVVMNPLFLIFLLVRPALSSFKGLRVRGSRFCCYRRFYDN